VLALGAVLLGARLLGLYTIGFVASGSMEPELPKGGIFLAVEARPGLGDIVVFDAPSGERIVHRVVGTTPDGLVTQGDANGHTDQANGMPLVDPSQVHIVPQAGGRPFFFNAPYLDPKALVVAQVVVVGLAIYSVGRKATRADPFAQANPAASLRRVRLRPHHFVLGAAGLLLLTSPLYQDEVVAEGQVGVAGSLVPTVARVEMESGETHLVRLGPLDDAWLKAQGPVSVIHAPALPGTAMLSAWGPTAAILPCVLLLAGLALALRVGT